MTGMFAILSHTSYELFINTRFMVHIRVLSMNGIGCILACLFYPGPTGLPYPRIQNTLTQY